MMKLLILVAICGFAVGGPLNDRGSLYYVDDILEDSSYGMGILDSIRGALNRFVDQAENLIARRVDIQAAVGDKIAELRRKIQSTVDLSVDEAGDVLSKVRQEIISLGQEITRRLKERPPQMYYYDKASELREIFGHVKKMITSDEGIRGLREYARALVSRHPIVFLLKAFLEASTDEDIKELFIEVFKGIQYTVETYGIQYANMDELHQRVREIVATEEGLEILKQYFRNLETSHPIVSRVRDFFLHTDNDVLHELLEAILGGSITYQGRDTRDVAAKLEHLFIRINKIIMTSNQGLASMREYAHQKLVSDHAVVLLIKKYLQYANDDDLRELFKELFKDLGSDYSSEPSELGVLFREVRGIVDTEEGLSIVKAYAIDLETSHPIALRIKAFFVNADEDELREALDALFGGLDYSSERR